MGQLSYPRSILALYFIHLVINANLFVYLVPFRKSVRPRSIKFNSFHPILHMCLSQCSSPYTTIRLRCDRKTPPIPLKKKGPVKKDALATIAPTPAPIASDPVTSTQNVPGPLPTAQALFCILSLDPFSITLGTGGLVCSGHNRNASDASSNASSRADHMELAQYPSTIGNRPMPNPNPSYLTMPVPNLGLTSTDRTDIAGLGLFLPRPV